MSEIHNHTEISPIIYPQSYLEFQFTFQGQNCIFLSSKRRGLRIPNPVGPAG
jgi:hypothetical protein